MLNELLLFLAKHKTEASEKATHTGMYVPLVGAWTLYGEDLDTFWRMYTNVYSSCLRGGKRLGIGLTEVQQDVCPLLIDIDIKTNKKFGCSRIYTQADIVTLVELYRTVAAQFVVIENNEAHVFEKPSPRKKDTHVKDGFHVMFNHIVIPKRVHKRIHQLVKERVDASRDMAHLVGIQTVDALIDDAITSNNWMLYGSVKKEDEFPYSLTGVIRHDESCVCEEYRPVDPRKYSIQGKTPNTLTSAAMVESTPDDTDDPDEWASMTRTEAMLSMLASERVEDEPRWIRVGMCLHNEDKRNLPLWIEWSKQSDKFKPGVCEKQWRRFRIEKGYSINSLCYWARMDNPEKYAAYMHKMTNECVLYTINCGAHYDIASILHCKYADIYRCVNPKKPTDWYFFEQHRWREMPGGYVLMNRMSVDLAEMFNKQANEFKRAMLNQDPNIVKENKVKHEKCLRLAYQVKDNNFKSSVLKECSRLFYDQDFEAALDSNVNLIGFENGVFDIQELRFRDGSPDDCVSKTTGMDYEVYTDDDPLVQEIYSFFEQVHPDKVTREYVLTIFATFLGGSCEEQTFQIWTGGGSNGKSTVVDLFELTFGDDYTGKFSTTLLTRDRANSNACTPELQDVMRKRFASMQEPNDNDVIYTGAMKEYTGGDKIYSRGLYQKPTPFKPQFKLVMLCNKMPTIKGWDYGTWRRIRVVKYPSSFVDAPNPENEFEFKKDRKLTKRFEAWKQPFMWILIERLKSYTKHGLKEPVSVLEASKEYKKKSDAYMSFLDENFTNTTVETDRVSCQEMYELFKVWWRNLFNSSPPSKTDLMDYIASNTKYRKVQNKHFTHLAFSNVEDMEV
jgi:P4 family phage/plasmid primase-like protien